MAKLSRRQVIAGGVGALVTPPLAYFFYLTSGKYKARHGLKYLTARDSAILEAVGETVIPETNPLGISIHDVDFVKTVDEMVGVIPEYNLTRIKYLLWSIEHVTPARYLYTKKFTKLDLENRTILLKKLETSSNLAMRAVFRALKGLSLAVYYNDSKVAEKLGLDRKCLV